MVCLNRIVTPKKNSDQIRLCVDLSRLNKFVQRERYHFPAQAVANNATENAKVFSNLGAPLDKESQLLTTFITLSAVSNSSVHRLAYLQFQNITTATWTKIFLGSLGTGGLLMTSQGFIQDFSKRGGKPYDTPPPLPPRKQYTYCQCFDS